MYDVDKNKIKQQLKKIRNEKDITQNDLANAIHVGDNNGIGGRTTITNWESLSNDTLPNLRAMLEICNYLDVDMDYLLGKTNTQSKDIQTMADTLNLSTESIKTLKNMPQCSALVESLLQKALFTEVAQRIQQIGRSLLLEDVVTTAFTASFCMRIRKLFDDYYFNTFPMDISPKSFCLYLNKKLPYKNTFDANVFINNNFLEEGKNFLENLYLDFWNTEPQQQYQQIIESIVEITYDYFMSLRAVELSRQRLHTLMAQMVDEAIDQHLKKTREQIQK